MVLDGAVSAQMLERAKLKQLHCKAIPALDVRINDEGDRIISELGLTRADECVERHRSFS